MTLVEMLVGLAIFGVIAAVVLTSLLQFTRVDTASRQQVTSDINAQQVTEQVKAAWQSGLDYGRNCVTDLRLPAGTTVTSQPLAVTFDPSAVTVLTGAGGTPLPATPVTACSSGSALTSPVPPMRRLRVEAVSGGRTTVLHFDILSPNVGGL